MATSHKVRHLTTAMLLCMNMHTGIPNTRKQKRKKEKVTFRADGYRQNCHTLFQRQCLTGTVNSLSIACAWSPYNYTGYTLE